jgi:hypothetical protein
MVEIDFPKYGICKMEIKHYNNGRIAIQFRNKKVGPIITLTVNLPYDRLESGEFFVKTWSENEPLTPFIRNSGIFIDTGKKVETGFVIAEVWKFSDAYKHLGGN